MNLAGLSIRRPAFISSVVILMLVTGYLALKNMAVDLFPNITFPVVTVSVPYPGAGPEEMETQVARVLEEEVGTLSGIKSIRSINKEGITTVIAEFTLETDVKYAEQQIRDRVGAAKRKLPADTEEPIIRRIDPADQPVVILSLTADLPAAELYDLANETIKPKLEQVNRVGMVNLIGGRKREIKVELDREKLKRHELSAGAVTSRIAAAGQNVPLGKISATGKETVFRALGEFKNLDQIESTIVSFFGNDVPVTVAELGKVVDSLEDENSRAYVNGKQSLFFMVFRQSGANTIAVVDAVKARVEKINQEMKDASSKPRMTVVRDGAKPIRANVDDVEETIYIGIILTVIVVFFFLGSMRSTIITGLALPTSLLGAFILMQAFGFSINVMSLLALSLAVGLLIDDAIVVRENIFRHNEMGKDPKEAALVGTREVTLAVVATTLTVIAVFGPIAFLQGIVGQFFKEFGLTVCFAMAISLFDALTIAPMLSAYFASKHGEPAKNPVGRAIQGAVRAFDRLQTRGENGYVRILGFTLRNPFKVIIGAVLIFVLSLGSFMAVPKTFISAQDTGEFGVALDLPPGTSLDAMNELSRKVDEVIRSNPEVASSVMFVGDRNGASNVANFFVNLVPSSQRDVNTSQFKDTLREKLKPFAHANPKVKEIDMIGAGMRPFGMNLSGQDQAQLEEYARKVFERLKNHPALKDVDMTFRPGKPEFQVVLDERKAERMGVSTAAVGMELRNQVEGAVPAVFRQLGREYDIRVRLREDQRNLEKGFADTYVPNINHSIIRLSDIAKAVKTTGPATIERQDRGRYIQINADLAADGPGLGAAMADVEKMFKTDIKLPEGMGYRFVGQAENFKELAVNMLVAAGLGIFFIYLVLASLYESFVTPFAIMLVLPLAACGAFFALHLTGVSLDLFSMIGCIMLLGIATKNSILLVDYIKQLTNDGVDEAKAIVEAGRVRLRPILMTSFALIAGMLPVAIGLNEASKQRTSMGIAIIGGLISSTLLTLVVVPAAYSFIERFRLWSRKLGMRWFGGTNSESDPDGTPPGPGGSHIPSPEPHPAGVGSPVGAAPAGALRTAD